MQQWVLICSDRVLPTAPGTPLAATALTHRCRRCAQQAGLTVDQVAPRLSFFFAVGMDFFSEVLLLGLHVLPVLMAPLLLGLLLCTVW